MKILGISPYGNACGIAEYAKQLLEALERIGAPVHLWLPGAETLDPLEVLRSILEAPDHDSLDLIWVNHHAGLHSRWGPQHVAALQALGIPVVVTLHDTRAGGFESRNSEQLLSLWEVADATIVHEPVADMPGVQVIRQGIPPPAPYGRTYGVALGLPGGDAFLRYLGQPILGTVGFNFPWKNYDRICEICREVGWAQVILSTDATEADERRWRALNPWILVRRGFLDQETVLASLQSCSATAFCYECANNGTSGAIRLGIAARKPVYAFGHCRQFRDLWIAEANEEPMAQIRWVVDFDDLRRSLKTWQVPTIDVGIVYLAERDSWDRQAGRYLGVFETARGRGRQPQ